MNINSVPKVKLPSKLFQIRWKEKLGNEEFPYAIRYCLIFFGYSLRIHIWKCSDAHTDKTDELFYHTHPWWFFTFIIKGSYNDCTPNGTELLSTFSLRYRKAEYLHYVVPNKNGCISLLLTGRPINKWGFLVNNRILRPLKFFAKFGKNKNCAIN